METAANNQPWAKTMSRTILDYLILTKPRVMSLLLFTALGGSFIAARGVPPWQYIVVVLVGGALASGGASALNMWYEEDIDQEMHRTDHRPVAGGRIKPMNALIFGVVLNIASFAVFYFFTNVLAASLAIAGSALYVVLYTALLKRTTTQNIVVGGAAGAVPPLVGYAAILGVLELEAWYLFAVVFFWTPPHFWALSLLIKDDYARAGVPMMPVVSGEAATRVQILLYTILMLPLTVMYYFATSKLGVVYLVSAVILGLVFFALAFKLWRTGARKDTLNLYKFSLLYLFLLFVALMFDAATV
ncbi:MAG: heme o synthase [Chloroflexi bacterium]|nr:heme o synthase [Chloroflexota bacterium]